MFKYSSLSISSIFLSSKWWKLRFWVVLTIGFVLAILLHRLFCVNTTVNKIIFGTV